MEQPGNVCGAIVTVDARRDGDCGGGDGGGIEVSVSEFNYSTERFFEVSDAVSALCGDAADEPRAVDEEEVRRFTSMVTFLTEWKYFSYEPKSVTFAYEGGFMDASEATISGIHLPQFSSASVPKKEAPCGKSEGLNCKDFVLHAGGSVWALDWCPRIRRNAGGYFKCEYLAVAAHPPGSFYHKIGIPLTGRGLVQIWCVLNVNEEGDSSTVYKVRKNRGRPRKYPVDVDGKGESLSNDKLKTRGRPRKYPPEFNGDVTPQKRARIVTRIKQSAQSSSLNQTETISLIDSSPGNLPFRDTPNLVLTNEESDLRHEIDDLSKVEMLSELDAKKAPDFPKKGRGRERKNPVVVDPRLSDLDAMKTLNFPKKGRGRPRKNPVAIEPTTSSNCAAVNLGKEVFVSQFTSSHEPTSDSNAYSSTLSSISELNLGKDFVFRRCESDVHPENSCLADANVEKLPCFLKHGGGGLIKNPLVTKPLNSTSSSSTIVFSRTGEGTLALPAMSGQKWLEGSGNLTISSNLSESDGITDGGSCARKFKRDGLLPLEGLIKTCTEMSPLQQKGKGGFRKDHSITELISSSSAMAAISGSSSLNSLGEDLYLSPNTNAPDKKAHNNVALRPQGDEVLGKFSGYLNVETIMPEQCRGRQRKQTSEAKSRDAPHVAEDSSAPSSLSASNSQFSSNIISPIKNLPNGNVYNDTDPGCEAEVGTSHTSARFSIQIQCKNKPRKVPPKATSSKGTCDTDVMNFKQLIPVCVELSDMPLGQNANRETGVINEEVMLGGMQPDGVLQEQECLDMGVVGSAVKSVLANSASKRRRRRCAKEVVKSNTFPPTLPSVRKTVPSNLESTCRDLHIHEGLDGHEVPLKIDKTDSVLPNDIALPRVVLCLAHMGRVAWDIKWRPFQDTGIECGHRMGYLAVLLGNGSLEVWEVPIPSLVRTLYTSCSESTDPRFLRLKPVFRCSKLNHGDKQSIPLVIEWSPSSRDLLLAGCHDGTVALWKFSETSSSADSKPLLCFNADSMPIRSISWAPDEGDLESSNLIVTAGGDRLRFWDLRDPYRPVWDYCPIQKHISAMDWLIDPRWIVLSYDDGFIRVLNLRKAASDIPLTGKPSGPSKTGTHSIACSAFAIWGIQVSPVTGHIAYCGVDGHTNHFQLTNVKIDRSSKNRVPQFSCGSLQEKDHRHIITIPVPNRPLLRSCGSLCASANLNQSGSDVEVTGSTKAFLKTKKSVKKEDGPKVTNALTCSMEEQACPSGAYTEIDGPRESFPAKSIAMHKVRWNLNRGSEKWLCYGGAAGIVRCYEIS